MLITDASFLIAYLNKKDSQHAKAVIDMAKIYEDGETFLINNLVIQEVLTLHNTKFKGKTYLHYFCGSIVDGNSNKIFFKMQTRTDFQKTTDLLTSIKKYDLSFVDLSLVIEIKAKKSGKLLTYDQALYKYAKQKKIPLFESVRFEEVS